jgi:hypothetical protein
MDFARELLSLRSVAVELGGAIETGDAKMPNLPIAIATAAALCAVPLVGAAQTSSSAPSTSTTPPAGAAGTARTGATTGNAAATGAAANTNATAGAPTQPLAAGMTVKDNTGAAIGQVAKLDTDAAGKTMATIKMGADSFQVPAANLATADGAATINLTQAQIAAQLHPKK